MTFDQFLALMDILLGENGCPWDKQQTHESLRKYLLEECYEVVEAINQQDIPSLKEELGDVLLQVVFHAKLAQKAGNFSIEDVIAGIAGKLVSRHTHVFGTDTASDAQDVMNIWEANKEKERAANSSTLADIPKALPALVRAEKVLKQSKIAMPEMSVLVEDIKHKLDNLSNACTQIPPNEEFGEVLLQMITLSKILEVNAEFSLTNATERFINTFSN